MHPPILKAIRRYLRNHGYSVTYGQFGGSIHIDYTEARKNVILKMEFGAGYRDVSARKARLVLTVKGATASFDTSYSRTPSLEVDMSDPNSLEVIRAYVRDELDRQMESWLDVVRFTRRRRHMELTEQLASKEPVEG